MCRVAYGFRKCLRMSVNVSGTQRASVLSMRQMISVGFLQQRQEIKWWLIPPWLADFGNRDSVVKELKMISLPVFCWFCWSGHNVKHDMICKINMLEEVGSGL